MLFSLLAASVISTDAVAVLAKEGQEVVVGANGNVKQIIRNANFEAPEDAKSEDKDWASKGPVSINLYYETKCPDCVEFINQTLSQLWADEELREHLNITINPYGNAMSVPTAKVSDGYKFFHAETTGAGWDYVHICQHGADECLGNLIQACAIEKVEQKKYMSMVICMASEPQWGIEKLAYECMDKAKIDPKPIKDCVTSTHGNQLMAQLGKATGEVQGRKGTPWVMVGGINLENVTDLMRSACHGLLNGPKTCAGFKDTDIVPTAKAAPARDDTFTVLPVISERKELVKMPTDV